MLIYIAILTSVLYLTGTFKTAPHPFLQVYIIYAELPSGEVLSVGYALLPSKDKQVYKQMWTVIKEVKLYTVNLYYFSLNLYVFNLYLYTIM